MCGRRGLRTAPFCCFNGGAMQLSSMELEQHSAPVGDWDGVIHDPGR